MRRTIIAIVAIGALVATGVAAAAATLNTYSAKVTFTGAAGSAKKPAALAYAEKFSTEGIGRPFGYPLKDVNLTITHAKLTTKGFKTCSANTINTAKNDTGCPKAALVGSGPVQGTLYNPENPANGTPCNPVLDVWNGGKGTLVYFFKVPAGHSCPVQTGQVNAWTGTIRQSGSSVISDNPLPPDVSTMAGGLPVFSSLDSEDVVFPKDTVKTHGKTVAFLASTGCRARTYSVSFTATNGTTRETEKVSGSQKC